MKRPRPDPGERARHRRRGDRPNSARAPDPEHARLLHELQVHQVEVESQNRELQEAQHQLEVSRDRYADLYDFAPVGYVTLDPHGSVLGMNLTLAEMLGINRAQFVGKPFRLQVAKADSQAFLGHLRQLTQPNDRAATELSLISRHRGLVPVVLQTTASADPSGPRLVLRSAITDISARKRAELALVQNQARLAAILNNVAEPVFSITPFGVIESANQAAEALFKHSREALVGQHFRLLLEATHQAAFDDYLAQLQAQEHGPHEGGLIELRGLSRTQETFPLQISISDVPLDGHRIYTVLVRDVTERHRLEMERQVTFDVMRHLSSTREIHRVIPDLLELLSRGMEASAGVYWEVSPSGKELRRTHDWYHEGMPSGAILKSARTLALNAKEGFPGVTLGMRNPTWINDVDSINATRYLEAAKRAGIRSAIGLPIIGQHRLLGVMIFFRERPGTPYPGQLQFYAQVGSRISAFIEGVLAERDLRRSETRLLLAQSIAMLGSFEVDLADGDHSWSQEARRILGIRPEEEGLSGVEPLLRNVHPEDRIRAREMVARATRDGTSLDIEYRVLEAGGALRHVHVLARPFQDGAGRMTHMVGTLHDMTERRILEREILQISENERRSLGHDLHDGLGQQLTAMELQCQTLLNRLRRRAPEFIGAFETVCHQLSDTVRQTRALAHGLSPIPLSDEGLSHALQELQDSLRGRTGIQCHLRVGPDVRVKDPTVAIHLYRITQEAVGNALRHGQARTINISLSQEDDRLVLRINNDGHHITKPRRDSNGMGLRIMQYRAGIIGATLRIACKPGDGTTISCILHQRP